MKAIENRHYRSLELDKILEMLASHATCADAKSLALSLTPQTDLYLAQALLKQTEDAHMLLARFGGPAFGGLHNVNNALQRAAAGGMLTMRELLEIAEVLRVIRSLSEWRSRSEGVETCLDNFFHALMPNKFLEERILNAILSEDEMADGASPTLQDIRRKIRAASSRVRDRLDQMIRSPRYQKFLQEPIVTQRNGRFVVPVKNENRGEVPGLVHDTSSSGATVFIEPKQNIGFCCSVKVTSAAFQKTVFVTDFLGKLCFGFVKKRIVRLRCVKTASLCFWQKFSQLIFVHIEKRVLPGKSFVPLIVGFGCNVPSVMGARTLDAPRERLMTIMMAPFMSCGARLAIFAVFAAAFFGQNGALAVFSLYMLGIVMAVLTGLMLKYTIMRGEATPFVMELPVYHVPHVKSLIIQTWQRLKGFVLRAGKVIIIVSIFLSAFNSFSLSGKIVDNINDSALASVSRVITPVFKPIGVHEDNWQATVGLFTGAMAKEVVVGTLNTLYTAENIQDEEFNPAEFNLGEELFSAVDETWQSLKDTFSLSVLMNPIEASKGDGEMGTGAMGVMDQKFGSAAAAYSYLIFVLLYVPCISVMGAIARESSRGWMGFSILWGLNIAYSLATLFYQVASYSQHPTYSLVCILAVILFNIVVIGLLRRARSRVDVELLATRKSVSSCCAASTTGDCH